MIALTNVNIIVAGPTCGKTSLVVKRPDVFADIDCVLQVIMPSFFEMKFWRYASGEIFELLHAKLAPICLFLVEHGYVLLSSAWGLSVKNWVPSSSLIDYKLPIGFWRAQPSDVSAISTDRNDLDPMPIELTTRWFDDWNTHAISSIHLTVPVPDRQYLSGMFILTNKGNNLWTESDAKQIIPHTRKDKLNAYKRVSDLILQNFKVIEFTSLIDEINLLPTGPDFLQKIGFERFQALSESTSMISIPSISSSNSSASVAIL